MLREAKSADSDDSLVLDIEAAPIDAPVVAVAASPAAVAKLPAAEDAKTDSDDAEPAGTPLDAGAE